MSRATLYGDTDEPLVVREHRAAVKRLRAARLRALRLGIPLGEPQPVELLDLDTDDFLERNAI